LIYKIRIKARMKEQKKERKLDGTVLAGLRGASPSALRVAVGRVFGV
jgi:hypothetical protein